MPLAKCSFGMIPLSRHSVDRSPRAFHSSTHNVVRASCFEVLSASVESRKLFLDVSLCLAGRCPWSRCLGSSSWRQRSALAATFRRMWGGAIPASAYKQGIGVAFKQPVIILLVSFRAMSTCPVCLERPHEEQAYSVVEKQSANAVVIISLSSSFPFVRGEVLPATFSPPHLIVFSTLLCLLSSSSSLPPRLPSSHLS